MFNAFVFTDGKILKTDQKNILKYIKKNENVVWIDLEDPNENEIDMLIDKFDFHQLSIEDAIFPQDHPKIEEFEKYVFITLYGITYDDIISTQELNIFLGKNYVITFHENKLNSITKLMNKINRMKENETGKLIGGENDITKGSDVLLYAIIDSLINEYFVITEKLDYNMEILENKVLEEKSEQILDDLFKQKKNILVFRKFITMEMQLINKLCRAEVDFIREKTKVYFRDIYDHIARINGDLEILREIIPSFIESYWSMYSKKLNQAMHRLTILATIAIPMALITSYYGMNLPLPEFKWGFLGVIFMWGLMFLSFLLLFLLLKWKKWI